MYEYFFWFPVSAFFPIFPAELFSFLPVSENGAKKFINQYKREYKENPSYTHLVHSLLRPEVI